MLRHAHACTHCMVGSMVDERKMRVDLLMALQKTSDLSYYLILTYKVHGERYCKGELFN